MIYFATPKYAKCRHGDFGTQPVGRHRFIADGSTPIALAEALPGMCDDGRQPLIVKRRRYGPSLLVLGSPSLVTSPH